MVFGLRIGAKQRLTNRKVPGPIARMTKCPRCALCGSSDDFAKEVTSIGGVLQSIGPLLGPFGDNDTHVHRLCALWSPEVYHENDKIRNVLAAVRRGRGLKCSYCFKRGATVGCCVDWCNKTYHIRCAQKAGCEINALEWILSCPEHSRKFRAQAKGAGTSAVKSLDGGWYAKSRGTGGSGRGGSKTAGEKRPRSLVDPLRVLNPFNDNVDFDEEIWQKKQRHRIERDIKALKPSTLGSARQEVRGEAPPAPAPGGDSVGTGGWDSVGGHEDVKRALKEAVLLPLMYQTEFAHLNLACPKGVLLHGEPGTGKTMVVRALANECNRSAHIRKVSFFSRKGADLLGKFQGEAERKLRLLFQEAQRLSPSIIFFDELDGIAPARGGKVSDQIHTSVVSTLLSLMDGLTDRGKVVVLAATNRADAIDPALRRPGRFDREIYFPLPDSVQRKQILQACTRHWDPEPQTPQLERLANLTEGFAGADLQSLCTGAALARLRREFPNILDGVEEKGSKRVGDIKARLEVMSVEDKDFMSAFQNITKACSHRTITGMLTTSKLRPAPWYILDAIWEPLYNAVCTLSSDRSLDMVASQSSSGGCPLGIKGFLTRLGAASGRAMVSASETRMMVTSEVQGDHPQSHPYLAGRTNVLICGGELSTNAVVAESALCALPGTRVFKVSLPQIIQEGHDKIAEGIISLTRKALTSAKAERIAIYCPNIHDWFQCAAPEEEGEDEDPLVLWNSFMQALHNQAPTCKVAVIATCKLAAEALPQKVRSFFQDSQMGMSPSRHKIIVNVEGASLEGAERLSTAAAEYLVAAASFLLKASREALAPRTDPPAAENTGPICPVCPVPAEDAVPQSVAVEAPEEKTATGGEAPAPHPVEETPQIEANPVAAQRERDYGKEEGVAVAKLESDVIQWVGVSLLKDERCGLTHGRDARAARDSDLDTPKAITFLDIASKACKGGYTLLNRLRADARVALDQILKQQASIDNVATKRGLAKQYHVSTSAAFATMDKIESICWKFDQYLSKKFPKVSDQEPADEPEAKEEGAGGRSSGACRGEKGCAEPRVFDMAASGDLLISEDYRAVASRVSKAIAERVRLDAGIGDFQEQVGKVLSRAFAAISEAEDEDEGGEAARIERVLLESIDRSVGPAQW